jgi:glycosyltransferase involved in cell wall biosynthesis
MWKAGDFRYFARPMRVAHFLLGRCNPDSANGVDKMVFYVSEAQANLGHDVGIFSITSKPAIPVKGVDVRVYRPTSNPFSGHTVSANPSILRMVLSLPDGLISELLAWSPDVVHFHSVHMPEPIRLARPLRAAGIPYFVSPHGALAVEAQKRHPLRKRVFAAMFERTYLNRAAFLHAVSRLDAEGARTYGARTRTVIAPNCIDVRVLPDHLDAGFIKRRFPEIVGSRVIMYLGRLDVDHKGLDLLLRAWKYRHTRHRSTLVLVGPDWGGGRAQLQRVAKTFGAENPVLFVGRASGIEKWNLLAGADVFVHPSRWEAGVPFGVLEAMLMRTPVLLTEPADPDRLTSRFRAGWLVKADVQTLVSALDEISGAPQQEISEMGLNARRLVEREFRWEHTARTLLRAYEEAVRLHFKQPSR